MSLNKNADLDDLMLAMDVVDTLRHQQSLVEHALAADERDAALTERIREIYHAQGITVTDEIIANGVKALREERFAYRAPPGGLKTWLAKCYVRRSRALKPFIAIVAALGVWWGANFVFSSLPEQRELDAAMARYNTEVAELHGESVNLKNRLERARLAVPQDSPGLSGEFRGVASSIKHETTLALETAANFQNTLRDQDLVTYQDTEDFELEREQAHIQLQTFQESINRFSESITTAERNGQLLRAFIEMPEELRSLTAAAKAVAAEPAVAAIANTASENAIAALKARDLEGATREKSTLENLVEEVRASYQILIVSQPGERTGVWRYPENNRNARNYYIVVEAVTPDGTRLERSIVSEENGKTYRVKRWAMRVNERTYNAVAADKRDDGIVQNKLFGEKPRGYINPSYRMNTTGASIVSW